MKSDLKDLVVQFAKFSVVGIVAFVIDYGLFLVMDYVFHVEYLIASAISFTLATVFNFVASMRYVFAGKEGQTRTQQFIIFFVLSVIGLGVNQLILWVCVSFLFMYAWVGKLAATAVVMLFNFVTRKIFLEDRPVRQD